MNFWLNFDWDFGAWLRMVRKLWILHPKIKISSPFLTANLWNGFQTWFSNQIMLKSCLACFKDSKKPLHMEAPESWGEIFSQCAVSRIRKRGDFGFIGRERKTKTLSWVLFSTEVSVMLTFWSKKKTFWSKKKLLEFYMAISGVFEWKFQNYRIPLLRKELLI